MKKTISVIAVLMIFLLIMGSAAAADVDVHLTGSHVSGDRGANVTVTLSLDEPTVLYSGLADLKYDESVLDLVEAGFVLSGTPEINRFDPDDKFPEEGVDGTGTFAMNTPTEQSGVLFTATFTIKSTAAVSETEVEIVPVPLKKSTTEVLTVGYTKCKITITSSTPPHMLVHRRKQRCRWRTCVRRNLQDRGCLSLLLRLRCFGGKLRDPHI